MSTFDLIINIIESLGSIGFIYFVFHKQRSVFLLLTFIFIETLNTTFHNYYLFPELSLTISSQFILFLYAYLLNRKNYIQNIFMTFLIFNINNFSNTTSMLITDIFFSFPFYQGHSYYFLAIVTRILFFIISYIIYRILTQSTLTFHKTNKNISILVILFILELLYSSCIELIFYNNIFDIYTIFILTFINLFVAILCHTFYESQKEQAHLLKLQEENIRKENQIKINHINEETIKHLTLWKHDINYIFTYIENYISNQRYDDALKTISIYRNVLNNYNLFINTNNDTLHSILIEYIDKLIQNDIRIYMNTDNKQITLSTEHYQKIMNLFFNHIIKNCQSNYQKEIWISYYTQSPYFTLSLEYTCYTPSLQILHNDIYHIIIQYKGAMKITHHDHKDILKIIIPT